jgi:hypothetical protein
LALLGSAPCMERAYALIFVSSAFDLIYFANLVKFVENFIMIKKKLNKLGVENSLWNNIRAKKGSGKKPTAEMLKQEKKINAAPKKKK